MESTKHLNVFAFLTEDKQLTDATAFASIEERNAQGLIVREAIILEIQSLLLHRIVPEFWHVFEPSTAESGADASADKSGNNAWFLTFQEAVQQLSDAYEELAALYLSVGSKFGGGADVDANDTAPLNEMLLSALLSQLPPNFNQLINAFYDVAFKVYMHQQQQHGDVADLEESQHLCRGCEQMLPTCNCAQLLHMFNTINGQLQRMQLLDRIAGQTLTSLIRQHIATHIRDSCQGVFNHSHLQALQQWLNEAVLKWLTCIYSDGRCDASSADATTLQDFKVKLTYFLFETYANLLIEEFFSIIIDYPDSRPAIDDLKVCLEMIDFKTKLIESLKKSLGARLLHAGVNTADILTAYVAAIRAIRYLDQSGVILEAVMNPIRNYLRQRSDTVRQVVTALTEDGPTELSEELAKGEGAATVAAADQADWENWQPEPMEAGAPQQSSTRATDIISMVLNIYGSKDLFVNEYRHLLADRLLTQLDFNAEKEIRDLELLKLRFGEQILHSCEVMLKDISDSKRINAHIESDLKERAAASTTTTTTSGEQRFDISTLIISSQFWPAFNKESLELPPEFLEEFEAYTKSYEALKVNRTLNWRHVTGRVNIEVELGDRVLQLSVTPTQAVILYHFQARTKWPLGELADIMKIPPSVLRRRIGFWQTQGIIRELSADEAEDVYELLEHQQPTQDQGNQSKQLSGSFAEMVDDECETAMASAGDQRQEELQVFWSYIVGMLTNLDTLPLERIHQMLRMFASHGPGIDFSREELQRFLQTKVREQKLIFKRGVYQLAK